MPCGRTQLDGATFATSGRDRCTVGPCGPRSPHCLLAVVACALPVAAAQAIPMGAYGNTARFDRLTGQKTKSGLVFLGWDQEAPGARRTDSSSNNLRDRPHIALHPEGRAAR